MRATPPSPSPLVRIRCGVRRCRRVLLEFEQEPSDWGGEVRFGACPRHGGLRRPFAEEVLGRSAVGNLELFEVTVHIVKLADLRNAFHQAKTRGVTIDEPVTPSG